MPAHRDVVVCVLSVLVACLAFVVPARAGDPASGPVLALAIAPAPLADDALAPPRAEPVLLCGKVWVDTKYVLGQNCAKACRTEGHSPAECRKLVPLCQSCWRQLQACANNRTIPPAERCKVCTERYAVCMRPFFK
jgi:hypothetical protein